MKTRADVLADMMKGDDPWVKCGSHQKGAWRTQGVTFKLRVGLHMGRPMAAIMAEGLFIKIKPTPEYDPKQFRLKVLDPTNPNSCLYKNRGADKRWRPVGSLAGRLLKL